jgi:hypothetical protein
MCSMSFVSVYWSWNTHMCQVICIPAPGMNFMKVHAFLLKGWFSSLNTLCELVSNRKSSSSSSSARESVTSTCYPWFKNMKWFWQDKHDTWQQGCKTSFIIPWWQVVRVTRSLVLYVCFVDRCLSFCTFSFSHCVVCSSLIHWRILILWYLQSLLNKYSHFNKCVYLPSP